MKTNTTVGIAIVLVIIAAIIWYTSSQQTCATALNNCQATCGFHFNGKQISGYPDINVVNTCAEACRDANTACD